MKYISFYTYPNFTLDDTAQLGCHVFLEKDATIIKKIVYDYSCEGIWRLRISRDGLIQFRSTFIEAEINNIELSWRGDLGSAKSFDGIWLKYLNICNAVHFCFECCMHSSGVNLCGIEFNVLSYGDISRVTYDSNDEPFRQASYRGGGINTLIRFGDYFPENIKKIAIPKKCIDYLCSYYLTKLFNDELLLQLVVKVGQSLSMHNIGNWSSSIVVSWFVVEWYIGRLWDDFIDKKFITGDRKRLLNGRDYTASIVIEHLHLQDIIDEENYLKINKLRKNRNKIAHEFINVNVDKNDSIEGLDLCKWVLYKISELEFPFHVHGPAIHGL